MGFASFSGHRRRSTHSTDLPSPTTKDDEGRPFVPQIWTTKRRPDLEEQTKDDASSSFVVASSRCDEPRREKRRDLRRSRHPRSGRRATKRSPSLRRTVHQEKEISVSSFFGHHRCRTRRRRRQVTTPETTSGDEVEEWG